MSNEEFQNKGFQPPTQSDSAFSQTGFQEENKGFSQGGFQETNKGFSQGGFQEDTNKGFSQGGFQDTNHGFQEPTRSQQGKVDTEAIAAFTKGSTQAIPIGYEQGLASGEAKKKGQGDSGFSQTGFIDTTQSAEYGRGYAYGFAQGSALGYAQGLDSPAKFPNTGFNPE